MLYLSTGLLGLIASTAAATGKAPDPAQQVQQQHMELTRMQQIDDRCHWLDATTRAALDATATERLAWLRDKAPAHTPPASDVAANTSQAKAVACSNNDHATAIRAAGWQMRATWALRAHALLDGADRPDWLSQQSPILPYRASLDQTLAALNEKYASSIQTSLPGIKQEAVQMLALACPNEQQQCPTDGTPSHSRAYAQMWVQQTATFAKALAVDPVKLQPFPN